MFEFLPHPDIKATSLADLTMQTNDYLFRLKESLEFMLMSIDIENLSPEFRSKLDSIGVDIQTTNDLREDGMAQMASNALTVEDVINSPLLDGKIDDSLEEVEESIGKIDDSLEEVVSDLNDRMQITDNPSAYCDFRFPISDDEYYYLSLKPDSMKYGYYEPKSGGFHYFNFEPLKNLLNNPKPITAEDDVLALEAGVYKADNCQAKNGQSPNALYLVLWGRDGADRHIIEFGANTGLISYKRMYAWAWGDWQTLNNDNYLPLSGGTVTGDLAVNGITQFGHETISNFPHSGRIVYGDYGTFWRNDGATLYLMFTNKGDPYGTFNNFRPLFFDLQWGNAWFGHNLTVGGALSVAQSISVGNNFIGTLEIQSANPVMIRSAYGKYGAFFYNEGGDYFYLLVTDANNPYGGFNGLRPFYVNMSNGDVTFGHTVFVSTPVQVTSDRRAKENIENLDDRYLLLWDALQPKSYYMKADKEKRNHIGYVAQEVEEAMQNAGLTYEECGFIHRRWVEKEDYKGYEYSLNYDGIGVIAQAKIKQQEERINALEKEIAELKALIINK